MVKSIKETAAKVNVTTVEVYIPDKLALTRTRKILECCLYGTELKFLFRLSKYQKREYNAVRRRPASEAIIIHTKEGSTYIKELKSKVSPKTSVWPLRA